MMRDLSPYHRLSPNDSLKFLWNRELAYQLFNPSRGVHVVLMNVIIDAVLGYGALRMRIAMSRTYLVVSPATGVRINAESVR